MSYRSIILLVLSVLNLVYQQGWLGGIASPLAPAVTSVTYVHEQRETPVPSAVHAALNRINREKGIPANVFDVDTKDGNGEVPDQYKVASTAAKEAGLPALVAVSGDKVVRVVKDPKTAEQVWEAAQ